MFLSNSQDLLSNCVQKTLHFNFLVALTNNTNNMSVNNVKCGFHSLHHRYPISIGYKGNNLLLIPPLIQPMRN
jgi:hypothetical protein